MSQSRSPSSRTVCQRCPVRSSGSSRWHETRESLEHSKETSSLLFESEARVVDGKVRTPGKDDEGGEEFVECRCVDVDLTNGHDLSDLSEVINRVTSKLFTSGTSEDQTDEEREWETVRHKK